MRRESSVCDNGGRGARGVRPRDPRRGRDGRRDGAPRRRRRHGRGGGGRRKGSPIPICFSNLNPNPNPSAPRGQMQELDEMKKRLKDMEEEAAALREMQAKVEKEMGAVQGCGTLSFL